MLITRYQDTDFLRTVRHLGRSGRGIGILLLASLFWLLPEGTIAQDLTPPLDTNLRPANHYRNAADSVEVVRLVQASFDLPRSRRDSALVLIREAAVLAEASVPEGFHVDVADSWHWVGRHALNQGKHDEAIEAFRHELALRDRLAGPDHPDRANCIDHLGRAIRAGGNPREALPFYRQALALRKRYYAGVDHPDLAGAVNNLALVESNLGHFNAADSLYNESLVMKRRIYRTDDIDLATTINNLGLVELELSEINNGVKHLEEGVAMLRRTETDRPVLAAGIAGLARAYYTVGAYDTALVLAGEVTALRSSLYLGDHPALASGGAALGRLLWKTGNRAEGEALLRESVAMSERLHPDGHAFTASAMVELGALLREEGEYGSARQLLADALAMRRKVLEADHPHIAAAMIELARAQTGAGRSDDLDATMALLKEGEEILERNFPGPHLLKADLHRAYGEIAIAGNKTGIATEEYRTASQMLATLFPDGHPERSQLLNALADLLEKTGDRVGAGQARKEAKEGE